MPLYGRRTSKPNPGALIDWSHPLAQGLAAFYAINEGAGPSLYDASGVSGAALAFDAGASWGSGTAAGVTSPTTTGYAQATAPAALQIAGPLTIAMGFRTLATPAPNNAELGGVTYASTSTTPFYAYAFQYASSTSAIWLDINIAGTLKTIGSAAVAVGNDYVISASHRSGSQALYLNGVAAGAAANAGNPTYGSGPLVSVGTSPIFARNPNILVYWMGVWSQPFGKDWHAALAANPWQLFAPPGYRIFGSMRRVRRTLFDRAGSRGVA